MTALGARPEVQAPLRAAWPDHASVMWIGAFDPADSPERVVPLARALPQLAFVMLAANYAHLDAELRRQLATVAPNLRVIDRPADDASLLALVGSAAVLLHTADGGPSAAWMTMAAAVGVPVLSVHADQDETIRQIGDGMVADGDLNVIGRTLARLRDDSAVYAQCCTAMAGWRATP